MDTTDRDPDLELVCALQQGDDSALSVLMERHQEALFGFIHRRTLNYADAVELTQETFVRAYFNIGRFRPDARFAAWLYRIALNLCRDYAKSRRVRNSAVTDSISAPVEKDEASYQQLQADLATPSEEADTREKLDALEEGIAQLPDDLRTAFVLSVLDGRSQQECAELLETTPKTVEMRVYRARKLLGAWLGKAGF